MPARRSTDRETTIYHSIKTFKYGVIIFFVGAGWTIIERTVNKLFFWVKVPENCKEEILKLGKLNFTIPMLIMAFGFLIVMVPLVAPVFNKALNTAKDLKK